MLKCKNNFGNQHLVKSTVNLPGEQTSSQQKPSGINLMSSSRSTSGISLWDKAADALIITHARTKQINGWFQSFPSQFTCVHAIFGCKGNICEQEQPSLVESRSSWREAQMWVSLPCTSKDKPVPPVLMRVRIHLLASWNDLKLPSSCFHVCFFPKWESDNTQYPCCSKKWLTCQAFSHGIFPERVGKVCQWKILGSFVMSFVFVVNKKRFLCKDQLGYV